MAFTEQRRGWPLNLRYLRSPPETVSATITVIGLVLFAILLIIATFALGWLFIDLASGDQRRGAEAAKTALPLVAAAIGLPLLVWRLLILNRQTRISEEKTQIDRETHYTSIFSRSIEQLGQTRELKQTIQTDDGSSERNITVPNIEVRLGGIHSLSRLAEESVRDRSTIENVLRSYVRENSWSDRAGQTTSKLAWEKHSVWEWAPYHRIADPKQKHIDDYNRWLKEIESQRDRNTKWAQPLSETRVDVIEALDAIQNLLIKTNNTSRAVLYECLFVSRHFNSRLLSKVRFRRCTFVRCTFDAQKPDGFVAEKSYFIECDFSGEMLDVKISNSFISNTDFGQVENGDIHLLECEGISITLYSSPKTLGIYSSAIHELGIHGDHDPPKQLIETELSLGESTLSRCYFGMLKLSSDSDIDFYACVEMKLGQVDLSDVTKFSEANLDMIEATASTIGPELVSRPQSWPAYDPNDNHIPF